LKKDEEGPTRRRRRRRRRIEGIIQDYILFPRLIQSVNEESSTS
jgi:hypothetical protein